MEESQSPAELNGMFANIEITLEVHENTFTVPEGTILTTTTGTQIIAGLS